MSFIPAIPLGGLAGYRFLERTGDTQMATHASAPEIQRNLDYFKEKFSKITSAEELVADRQLLTVVMGAYGLGDEVDKKAFIREILEGGVEDTDALGYRLNNQSYIDLATDLKFDTDNPRTGSASIQEKIISNYVEQTYEIAVGDQDINLRQALDFKRRAPDFSERSWFAFMGDTSMRDVLQTALNLPSDVASLDVDKQKELYENQALKILGTKDAEALSDPANIDKLVTRYLVISQAQNGFNANTPGATALTLLSNISSGFGASATQSLFQSNF